eukprot:346669-Prymnesium_polylepis.1
MCIRDRPPSLHARAAQGGRQPRVALRAVRPAALRDRATLAQAAREEYARQGGARTAQARASLQPCRAHSACYLTLHAACAQ